MPVRSEDYMALLYRFREHGVEARLNVIAKELGVSSSSAAKQLAKLSLRGYVVKRGLTYALSPSGFERAEQIVRNHRVVERFLTDVMNVDLYTAHELAHSLEHVARFAALADERLGKPATCPHGNPVPGRGFSAALPLNRVGPGSFRVVRVGELGGSLEWAMSVGLRLGDLLEVDNVSDQGVLIKLRNSLQLLPLDVASFIFVERGE